MEKKDIRVIDKDFVINEINTNLDYIEYRKDDLNKFFIVESKLPYFKKSYRPKNPSALK